MKKFFNQVIRFAKDESGPTAVEYAIMLSFIVMVCIAAITQVGNTTSTRFEAVANILR